MADDFHPPLIWIGKHLVQWEREIFLHEAASLLMMLCGHDENEIMQYVVPALKIKDLPMTEEEMQALLDDRAMARAIAGAERARRRRYPLKGLAMELLAASILRHLDRCPMVVAECATRDKRPHAVAQGGAADVSAYFPCPGEQQEFTLLAEVSAKRNMSRSDYSEQLESGLIHANAEWEGHPGRLIYCLLANNGKIHVDERLHKVYLDFIKENKLTAESDIRMVPMHAPDFGILAGLMASELSPDKLYFEPEVLRGALDTTYRKILEPELPGDRMWMIDTFKGAIDAGLSGQEVELGEEFRGPGET